MRHFIFGICLAAALPALVACGANEPKAPLPDGDGEAGEGDKEVGGESEARDDEHEVYEFEKETEREKDTVPLCGEYCDGRKAMHCSGLEARPYTIEDCAEKGRFCRKHQDGTAYCLEISEGVDGDGEEACHSSCRNNIALNCVDGKPVYQDCNQVYSPGGGQAGTCELMYEDVVYCWVPPPYDGDVD